MIIPFRVCGLSLEVRCSGSLAKVCSALLAPFVCSEPGRYTLSLALKPQNQNDDIAVFGMTEHQLDMGVVAADKELVSAAVGFLMVYALSQNAGLLLHAAGLVLDGRAYLFVGPSGAGKSTLARNANGARVVHEDKIAVRRESSEWRACGVPMLNNIGRTGDNCSAPLEGVYLIEKNDCLRKVSLSGRETLNRLPSQVIVPFKSSVVRKKAFQNLLGLVSEAGCYRLLFQKDSDVGTII